MIDLTAVVTILAGVLGLLIGSFLNVVIWRVPQGMSIVTPPSACPHCHARIKWYDNIPVVSWLVLGGKCRNCKEPISVRYPLVELATGISFAVVAWFFGRALNAVFDPVFTIAVFLMILAYLYFAAISIALALIDLDTHTLPNKIVLPSYAVAAILLGTASVLTSDWWGLIRAAIGMVALWLVYFLLAIIRSGGMGFGDVKLAGVIGIYLGWLGWGPLVVGGFSAFLLGGLFGLILILARRAGRKSGIPFGPWMLAGAWVGTFFGAVLWNGYLQLFGLA